ncbi:MAG: FecR family protein [Lachnospiraceae bacterium]|jgi:hypothetical protein|nr:FecR family protein [Lachnospiraceae bacterium]
MNTAPCKPLFLAFIALALSLTACKGTGSVSVLEVTNSVNVDRGEEEIAARKGMRLQNLDTVRTDSASSAWLSLDDTKAVELSELTALQIDQQARGFVLTLASGEIKSQIDQPLATDEDFAVQAGNLVLAVRGTVFTVSYAENLVNVGVESGTVAVLDIQGNELAVLGAGESGEYEARDDLVLFGDYVWRVLEERDGKALLLSEYVLEDRPYHNSFAAVTWADCDLRAYLNGEFYNSFSESERARIVETHNENKNNPYPGRWYGRFDGTDLPVGGPDTDDYIFLLSLEEVVDYFGNSGDLASGELWTWDSDITEFVRPDEDTSYGWAFHDEYDEARVALLISKTDGYTFYNRLGYWWLRTPGFNSYSVMVVAASGHINVSGDHVYYDTNNNDGIRPAMWVVME